MRAQKEISWRAQDKCQPIIRNPLKEPNPFVLPTSTDLFGQKDERERNKTEKAKKQHKMTIVQRAIPKSPYSSRRAIQHNYEQKMKVDLSLGEDGVKPVGELRQRQQHTNQLIQEQREIFLSNLLISRHEEEIERLQNQKDAKNSKLESLEVELKESQNIMKTSTSQNDNIRSRYKKRYDEQLNRRNDVNSQVKNKKQQIAQMETEITKLEEILNQYQAYDELLRDITNTIGERPKTITEFMDFFEKLENESLFIVNHVEAMQAKTEETEIDIDQQIREIQANLNDIDEEIEKLENEEDYEVDESSKTAPSTHLDRQNQLLQKQIGLVFKQCFKTTNNDQNASVLGQNSLTMLTMIEAQIEAMSRVVRKLDPLFVAKKLKLLNEKKRKEQREANQRKKEIEQKKKIEQMKERATKPVKKRDGRPLMPKVQVTKITKKDPEKRERELQEKARVEQLLYGSIFD